MAGGKHRRRGSILSAELLFILPILLLMALGLLELGSILHGRQRLAAACREGARMASISGDPAEAEHVVRLVLGPDPRSGLVVEVSSEHGPGMARPGEIFSVVVGLPCHEVGLFASDLFGMGNQMLYSQAVMRRE